MKRFIGVPSSRYDGEKPPENVISMARIMSLPIKKVENAENIDVFIEPEIVSAKYSQNFCVGKIWELDIVNEFIKMNDTTKLIIDSNEYKPKILEAHVAKFRVRIESSGKKTVKVFVDDVCIFEESISEKI